MPHHFFAYMNRMKYIRRWGLMRNTQAENDMEHAFQTAMIAHAIALLGNARYRRDYDAEHIMALAMYHDASEVITGDLPTPVKHNNPVIRDEYHRLEAIADQRLLRMLPEDIRPTYEALIGTEEKDAEWRIVKAADKMSAYIKCIEERKAGNNEFASAEKQTLDALHGYNMPEVEYFIEHFIPAFEKTLDELGSID